MASIIIRDVKFSATPEKHYLLPEYPPITETLPPRKSRLLLSFPSLDTDEKTDALWDGTRNRGKRRKTEHNGKG